MIRGTSVIITPTKIFLKNRIKSEVVITVFSDKEMADTKCKTSV